MNCLSKLSVRRLSPGARPSLAKRELVSAREFLIWQNYVDRSKSVLNFARSEAQVLHINVRDVFLSGLSYMMNHYHARTAIRSNREKSFPKKSACISGVH